MYRNKDYDQHGLDSTEITIAIIGGLIMAVAILGPIAAGVYRLLLWAGAI